MAAILAFVDFSNVTRATVRIAREIARAFELRLILMHISSPAAESEGRDLRRDISRGGVAAEMRRYKHEIETLANGCRKLGVDTRGLLVRSHSIRGNPVPKMVRELNRVKPMLIVMGTHQHGRFFEVMFGSATSRVVHNASCPILLVPSKNAAVKWPRITTRTGRVAIK